MNRFKILKGTESPCFAPKENKKRASPQRADIQALVGRAGYRDMGSIHGWTGVVGFTGIQGYVSTGPQSEAARDLQSMHGINLEERG